MSTCELLAFEILNPEVLTQFLARLLGEGCRDPLMNSPAATSGEERNAKRCINYYKFFGIN